MHKFGKALDFDVKDLTAGEVRKEIVKKQKLFPFIKRIEKKVQWIHIDLKETNQEGIYLFNP